MLYNVVIRPIEYLIELIYVIMERFLGHPGYAVIAVSLTVSFLCLPLYLRAEELQKNEGEKQKKLKRWTDHINRHFKGEEKLFIRTCYYNENGYHPYDAINGTIPLLLQIPFFLAAYHFLSNLDALKECTFFFISDMGSEDALLHIGTFPINLLPIAMTAVNCISTFIYSRDLTLKQKIQPYALALVFLVLLYHSPSGLVLYWLCNNLFSLIKNTVTAYVKERKLFVAVVICLLGNVFMAIAFGRSKISHLLVFRDYETLMLYGVIYLCSFIPLAFWFMTRKGSIDRMVVHAHKKGDQWIVLGGLTVLCGLLIPLTVIGSAPLEFVDLIHYRSPLHYVWTTFSVSAGVFLLWGGIIYWLCSEKAKNTCLCFFLSLFGISILDYFCFRADVGKLTMELIFDHYPRFDRLPKLINLILIVVLALAVIFLMKKYSRVVIMSVLVLAVSMLAMSLKELISVKGALKDVHPESYFAEEDRTIPLSRNGRNVMVIMLDRAVGLYIPFIMEEKPELAEKLDGFTYYPNTVSFGPYTDYGSQAIFGGYDYIPEAIDARSDVLMTDKVDEALRMMPELFSKEGARVTVCDLPDYTALSEMHAFDEMESVNAFHLESLTNDGNDMEALWANMERSFFFYSLYRMSPPVIQDDIYDAGGYLSSVNYKTLALPKDFYRAYAALGKLEELTVVNDSDEDTLFMYDNNIAHSTATLQLPDYTVEDVIDNSAYDLTAVREVNGVVFEYGDDGGAGPGHYCVNMKAIIMLGEYFDWMREQGVYDNTRIIIVADHGSSTGQFTQFRLPSDGRDSLPLRGWMSALNPLLLVKDFDAEGFHTDDRFMTNADTPAIAMEGIIDNPVNPYTGNPVNMQGKKDGINTFLTESFGSYYAGQTQHDYGDAVWYHVHDDIFEMDNWSVIK